MRSLFSSFLLTCFTLLCLSSAAQPVTVPDNKYGEGGTKTSTTTQSADGIVTVTEEFHKAFNPPKLKERTRRIKNRAGGDSIVITEIFDEFMQGELKDSTIEKRYDRNGDMYYMEAVRHDAEGTGISSGIRTEKQPDGDWSEYEYNPRTKQFEKVRPTRPKKIKEHGVTGYLASCDTARIEWSAGYMLSFNGVYASVSGFLNPRLALILDISYHYKKTEFTWINTFLMAGIQYDLNKNIQSPFRPRLRFLMGQISDIIKTEARIQRDELAVGLGMPINYRISKNSMVGVVPDFFLKWFDKEWSGKFRLGIGFTFRTGCK